MCDAVLRLVYQKKTIITTLKSYIYYLTVIWSIYDIFFLKHFTSSKVQIYYLKSINFTKKTSALFKLTDDKYFFLKGSGIKKLQIDP